MPGESLSPFALGYMEPVDNKELEPIDGKYDPAEQVWLGSTFRPGNTISTVPTYLSPTVTRADNGRDD